MVGWLVAEDGGQCHLPRSLLVWKRGYRGNCRTRGRAHGSAAGPACGRARLGQGTLPPPVGTAYVLAGLAILLLLECGGLDWPGSPHGGLDPGRRSGGWSQCIRCRMYRPGLPPRVGGHGGGRGEASFGGSITISQCMFPPSYRGNSRRLCRRHTNGGHG